ncbi:hypothetical protein G6O69_34615 [Pseudenhygromyxa sp. WMMC2535]|uniref:hypothetical protein n=1 Tax=Pseudenhygromyxa sp. WMMC2535 TaxID=2712867 RepID=UPI00155315B5|nr:hypothetical protein [Pseudenhygromyxa sp. WMMC2535]NVB43007.1 hypothetical protein [Pseudenhygromyxa sp. WMMC2535]
MQDPLGPPRARIDQASRDPHGFEIRERVGDLLVRRAARGLVFTLDPQGERLAFMTDEYVDAPTLADDRLAEADLRIDQEPVVPEVVLDIGRDAVAILVPRHHQSISITRPARI